MNTYAHSSPIGGGPLRWLDGAAAWLDQRGKLAWIAALVITFAVAWPIGLAVLAYMIWSKRMFSKRSPRQMCGSAMTMSRSSGNTAFDAYREETLRRLQDEQASFEQFLGRLREAKDKAEFDQFMNERARAPRGPDNRPDAESDGDAGDGAKGTKES
ncbi:DUF2852 domain-containing protein [Roseovarius sp. D0-M9]|uniref:DUF2852 domain-containing protein n=1 Tax=Roseovarius sp. D0-M9 TaxID=3127117 RepID=UPI00301045E3